MKPVVNRGFALERLQRDVELLHNNPIQGVAMAPVDDDLFLWHGNVSLHGSVYHFVVTFTDRYPHEAPSVRMFCPLPHPNVAANGVVCCEVLGNLPWADQQLLKTPGWSAAYGPYAIQLTLLALAEGCFPHHHGLTVESAGRAADAFVCKRCQHGPDHAHPALPTRSSSKVHVPLPKPELVLPREVVAPQPRQVVVVSKPHVVGIAATAAVATPPPAPRTVPTKAAIKAAKAAKAAKKVSEWIEVTKQRKPKVTTAGGPAKKAAVTPQKKKSTATRKVVAAAAAVEVLPVGYTPDATERNRRKRAKRKLAAINKRIDEVAAATAAAAAAAVVAPVASKKKANKATAVAAVAIVEAAAPQRTSAASSAMGSFGVLGHDVLCHLLRYLPLHDVLRVAVCSKGLNAAASKTVLWRDLYQRAFPETLPRGVADFRHAYTLRVQGIVSELTCFFTRKSMDDAVLALPITYTRNPKTNRIDHVEAYASGLLSTEAFAQHGCRTGARGEPVKDVLPLYLTREHWSRALPALRKTVARTYPDVPFAEGCVSLLCAALNTLTVLLADRGVAACHASTAVYAQLQRVFLAVCADVDGVQALVDGRVARFARDHSKAAVPSLGDFIPMLLVSRSATWPHVRGALVRETLARNVLWACRAHSQLARLDGGATCDERLRLTWDACRVSARLLMLQALFVATARRGQSLAEGARHADRLYGFPSSTQYAAVARGVAAALDEHTFWPHYFRATLGIAMAPAAVEAALKDAVRDSRAAGYHSASTNFAAVQASGISTILRKGESYSTGKDVNAVVLSLGWNFPGATIFLDASCLFFSRGDFVCHVDYNNNVNDMTLAAAMHSGDNIDNARKSGEHTIVVALRELPASIDAMYLVLSAWTQNLAAVMNPSVRLVEQKSNTELCSYTIERAGTSQALVMARIVRSLAGWKVEPIGVTSYGTVRDYRPICETIRNYNKRREE